VQLALAKNCSIKAPLDKRVQFSISGRAGANLAVP